MKYAAKSLVKINFVLFLSAYLTAVFSPFVIYGQESQTPQTMYGIASWYGYNFAGHKTASGQDYDPTALTTAHETLPFGTILELENLSTGKKTQVIVNDRGPIEPNRIFNVSEKAAEALGFLKEGTGFLKAVVIQLGNGIIKNVPVSSPYASDTEPPQKKIVAVPVNKELSPYNTPTPSYEDLFLNDEDLELMDDGSQEEFVQKEPRVVRQNIPSDSTYAAEPQSGGFSQGYSDVVINDPLSNIVINPEDEFVAAPIPSYSELEDPIISPEDPFADLFTEDGVVYEFQDNVNNSTVAPSYGDISQNIHNEYTNIQTPIETIPATMITQSSASLMTNSVYAPSAEPDNLLGSPVTHLEETTSQSNSIPAVSNIMPVEVKTQPSTELSPVVSENAPIVKPDVITHDYYIIQLGAFKKQNNALKLYQKLRDKGYNAFITDVKVNGQNLVRVRVGYFNDLDQAIQVSQKLEAEQGLENRIIKIDYNKLQ